MQSKTALSPAGELEGALGIPVFWREEIGSTNDWAKAEASGHPDRALLFVADHQVAGRGRSGHSWSSQAGTSIAMSLVYRTSLAPEDGAMLTAVMGLAAARAIRELGGIDVMIKWPNDIVCDGKKICGILSEYLPSLHAVVIGVGINVNEHDFPDELQPIASSMRILAGRSFERTEVISACIRCFLELADVLLRDGDLRGLRADYEALLANRGKEVRVLREREPYMGTALGINERGALLVRRDDTNEIVPVLAGEVSLRGRDHYI